MTATPIPRTLALTLYGDLDVSVIRDMPPGRLPTKTVAKPESRREDVYAFVREQLDAGRQAYVVYPLVEESDKIDLKAATEMADHLAQDVFPQYRLGLLHGRMKSDAKDRVMKAFAAGELQMLVSTTVVEVGVDVAERERDARRARRAVRAVAAASAARPRRPRPPPVVLLPAVSVAVVDEARARLQAMTETTDGFEIAERDLRAARPRRFLRHAAGRPADVPVDRSRPRPGLLDTAKREADAWLASSAPTPAALRTLLDAWEQRFRLVHRVIGRESGNLVVKCGRRASSGC